MTDKKSKVRNLNENKKNSTTQLDNIKDTDAKRNSFTINNLPTEEILNQTKVISSALEHIKPGQASIKKAIEAAMMPSKSIQLATKALQNNGHIAGFAKSVAEQNDKSKELSAAINGPHKVLPARTNKAESVKLNDVVDLGKAIRKARKARGLTQQSFADLAGVGRRFISELEKGKKTLEIGKVLHVAKAVGIQISFQQPEQKS